MSGWHTPALMPQTAKASELSLKLYQIPLPALLQNNIGKKKKKEVYNKAIKLRLKKLSIFTREQAGEW